ncbi:MAG: DUF4147 domain-containing protein, partial [Rhodothermales bacterium]|nr:DUF4147 domain-containing protein [Rhodothermales bacterium]
MRTRLVQHARQIYEAAVRAVQADRLFDGLDLEALLPGLPEAVRAVSVVGAGKGAMAMAGAMEPLLQAQEGAVVVPRGYRVTLPRSQRAPRRCAVLEGGHPLPDAAGHAAARRALALADALGPDDLLVVLLSGGGSSLWPAPAGALTLDDVHRTHRLLIESGADIHRINTVRKHLSEIKGGRLAARAAPARVLALVVSDVVGDDLTSIASGPTVPDPTTFADALAVLGAAGLTDAVPPAVLDHLQRGASGEVEETPKPGDARFGRIRTQLLGTNRTALAAARHAARALGYSAQILDRSLTGEARDAGARLAHAALNARASAPICLLWGGETTVTVTGAGRGGRNQELALAAAQILDGV